MMRKLGLINCEGNIVELYVNSRSVLTMRALLNNSAGYLEFTPLLADIKAFLNNQSSLYELIKGAKELFILAGRKSRIAVQTIEKKHIYLSDRSLNDNGQDVVEENVSLIKQLLGIKK